MTSKLFMAIKFFNRSKINGGRIYECAKSTCKEASTSNAYKNESKHKNSFVAKLFKFFKTQCLHFVDQYYSSLLVAHILKFDRYNF